MSKEEVRARKVSNRQMLELIRRYENDNKRAARHLVNQFMQIPVGKRPSDKMLEKMEKVVDTYRRKASHLLSKDKARRFLRKKHAHELDESFGHEDSHPSMFGTQPEGEHGDYWESDEPSDSEMSSESGGGDGEEEGETGSDEAMDDVDDLSQGLSQLSTSQKRRKRRGKYKKRKDWRKLDDPKMNDQTRRDRMKAIKNKLQEFANQEELSLIVIIALFLKNEAYTFTRHIARVADAIIRDEPLDPYISIQEAIYLRYGVRRCFFTSTFLMGTFDR